MPSYIACDLGAESGRVMLGTLDKGRVSLEELHRFPTAPSRVLGTLRWDVLRIFDELKTGLREVARRNLPIASVSVDSWGVDYIYVKDGKPHLAPPYCYRDGRTDGTFARALERIGRDVLFQETGIQLMPINTLFQLMDDVENNAHLIEASDKFLMIADYVNYLFTGTARQEESNASTTQLYNTAARRWSGRLAGAICFPERCLPEVVPSGTRLGKLLPELQEETRLGDIEVIAGCTHDTGSAVAAVPGEGNDWAYLSSGTWSLLGVELAEPLITPDVQQANFTNELGFGGTVRFLKNVSGLYILQQCRKLWQEEGKDFGYDALMRRASGAAPLRSIMDPAAPRFLKPENMIGKIRDFCRETSQPVPETPGEITRCILESLALGYRRTLATIEGLIGRSINRLHIVGGGSQSELLNQFAANATGKTVIAGPVEATALGNVLIQAVAAGDLKDLPELRRVVGASFDLRTFRPREAEEWKAAADRFERFG